MKSFISWIGGKSRLAPTICHFIPEHTCYVEPFAGAGWVFFRKGMSKTEVLNDADSDLVTLYLCLREHPDELIRQLDYLLPSRKLFTLYVSQEGLTDIQRAARLFYLIKNAFGAKLTGRPSFGYSRKGKSAFNAISAPDLLRAVHKRLSRVFIENVDFAEVFRRYDSAESFFYCDPPYMDIEFYREPFEAADHLRLCECLADARGNWLLSYNDHPRVRELYADFPQYWVGVRYTCGLADKQVRELLVAKRPLSRNLLDTAPKTVERIRK